MGPCNAVQISHKSVTVVLEFQYTELLLITIEHGLAILLGTNVMRKVLPKLVNFPYS